MAGALTGVAAAGAGLWLARSQAWSARFLRERLGEARRSVHPAPACPAAQTWDDNQITVAWLGHATVLINFQGLIVLTDPVFSTRIGLPLGIGTLGPKRFVAPALTWHDIPRIDVLALSHAHLDHLDLPTLRRLPKPGLAVTAPGTADLLENTPARQAVELRWGDRTLYRGTHGELVVEAIEVKHWGARWRHDTFRGYNGYILRRGGRSILFGGDTAMTPLFAGYRSKGPFDIAIMPIAAYRPWIRSHCTPEEAVRMADQAGARHLVPVHHSTFKLSDEPLTEPMERLEQALRHEAGRVAVRRVGETFALA